MRRRHLRIRRWLALAAAVATLSFAASASAMPGGDGGGGQSVTPTPVVVPSDTSGGFNWSDAAIGAGIALGVVVGAGAVVRSMSNHRRLAGVPH